MTRSQMDMRDTFLTVLYERARSDKQIVILSNDYGAPSLDQFRKDFPHKFINGAISEQNIVSMAAGLAECGKNVLIYSIASFIVLRALEQIKIDLCVMNLPVTILAVGGGYAYDVDGPTHHVPEDLAIMQSLGNMKIYSPSNSATCQALAHEFADGNLKPGPTYIRLDRGKWPVFSENKELIKSGLAENGNVSSGLMIFATGIMVHTAHQVAEDLRESGILVKVIEVLKLKPFNKALALQMVAGSNAIITIEENVRYGGLADVVSELVTEYQLKVKLKRFCLNDEKVFAYGKRNDLHVQHGLSAPQVVGAVLNWLHV